MDLDAIKNRHKKGGWEFYPLCTTCMDKEGENSLEWPCDAWLAADAALLATARAAGLEKAIIRALKACPFCEAGQCRADAHEWLALALAAALAPAAGEP